MLQLFFKESSLSYYEDHDQGRIQEFRKRAPRKPDIAEYGRNSPVTVAMTLLVREIPSSTLGSKAPQLYDGGRKERRTSRLEAMDGQRFPSSASLLLIRFQ